MFFEHDPYCNCANVQVAEGAAVENSNYPGELATPQQIRQLADQYRRAADHLLALGRKGDPLSRAPFRFAAIHAIELYLSAFLLHSGRDPAEVRGLQHNLAKRTALAVASRLALRRRTVTHLTSMTENREYLTMRYGPEMTATVSQTNRLSATLQEVGGKVSAALERCPHAARPGSRGLRRST